jgi:hypothetical protein
VNSISGEDYIVLVPGQFNSEGSVERLFSSMELEPIYGDPTNIDQLPPSIVAAWSEESNGALEFFVQAEDSGAGVSRVFITYVADGRLITTELNPDPVTGFWTDSVAGLDITVEFLVQAVDGAGNTVADSNNGHLYSGGPTNQIINFVGQPHTFTITVWQDLGGGQSPASAVKPTVDLFSNDGAVPEVIEDTCASVGTNVNGQCMVTFVSDAPGTVGVNASVNLGVPGFPDLTVSAQTLARKTFVLPLGKIAPTQTTCENYLEGTAADLDTVQYGVRRRVINNAAPGVFFYYTKFAAPGHSFMVQINQISIPIFKLFEVQNLEQIRLFNSDCSSPSVDFTPYISSDGQASVWIDLGAAAAIGDGFILSVKYDTSSIVGADDPKGNVLYSFEASVDGEVVDFVPGLTLSRK